MALLFVDKFPFNPLESLTEFMRTVRFTFGFFAYRGYYTSRLSGIVCASDLQL